MVVYHSIQGCYRMVGWNVGIHVLIVRGEGQFPVSGWRVGEMASSRMVLGTETAQVGVPLWEEHLRTGTGWSSA